MAADGTCCCGFCSLRSGTQLISILFIISSVFPVLADISTWGQTGGRTSSGSGHGSDSELWIRRQARDHGFKFMEDLDKMYELRGMGLLLGTVQFILSALLGIGAVQDHAGRCTPWLYYNAVLTAIGGLILVGYGVHLSFSKDLATGVYFLAAVTITVAVNVYLINVVRQFIKELKVKDQRRSGMPIADTETATETTTTPTQTQATDTDKR